MSDSLRPQRRQPTRLPHPWGSPGKNTGVGTSPLSVPQTWGRIYTGLCGSPCLSDLLFSGILSSVSSGCGCPERCLPVLRATETMRFLSEFQPSVTALTLASSQAKSHWKPETHRLPSFLSRPIPPLPNTTVNLHNFRSLIRRRKGIQSL